MGLESKIDFSHIKIEGDYYLAHPFLSREKIREWELGFEQRAGIKLVNPFYDIIRDDVALIDSGKEKRGEREPAIIVERDLYAISKVRKGVIAVIDGSSSQGTIMEIVYAKKLFQKEVLSIITNGDHDRPWLRYHSDRIFTSFEGFERWWNQDALLK
ncbi:hypothetical protein JXB28_00200 [Candidatus Woesearchaeota archaeon]|nr:hypothetical protein [Candidatus Woesearchaeota archaeon]